MQIYVGGAIDNNSTAVSDFGSFVEVIRRITGGLAVMFNPASAFVVGEKAIESGKAAFGYIKGVNDHAIIKSDVAVFLWTDKSSFGVPIEIELCAKSDKHFVVLDKSSRTSAYLNVIVDSSSYGKIVKDEAGLAEYFVNLGSSKNDKSV